MVANQSSIASRPWAIHGVTLSPMLSKVWTVMVAISFVFLAVLWLALSIERMGLPTVAGFIVLALFIRRQRTDGTERQPLGTVRTRTHCTHNQRIV
jgi:hypothetical protein